MTQALKWVLPIVFLLFVAGCKDKPPPVITSPDYSENYKYYPIKDGREWNYEKTIVDSIKGTTTVLTELARYYEDSLSTIYFRNGVSVSASFWTNNNNKLGCCIDVILLDYNHLGCVSDSVLIYNNEKADLKRTIYQYCEKKFATQVVNYSKTECIKTLAVNKYTDGHSLVIIQYFGFGIGLVFRQETSFNKSGKMVLQTTQKLLSHNF